MAPTTPAPTGSAVTPVSTKHRTALKLVVQARIACANSVHHIDTLDGFTDDWPEDDAYLTNVALDLHLHCEAAAKECQLIIATLDAFATPGEGGGLLEQLVEMVCIAPQCSGKDVLSC